MRLSNIRPKSEKNELIGKYKDKCYIEKIMRLTPEQVEHVARLSYLELTPEELEHYTKDLTSIIRYIEKLNKLDTTNVQPTYQVNAVTNVMREDEVRESMTPSLLLQMAPQHDDHAIQVPKIIELEP